MTVGPCLQVFLLTAVWCSLHDLGRGAVERGEGETGNGINDRPQSIAVSGERLVGAGAPSRCPGASAAGVMLVY